jgi:integrase
MVLMPAAVNHRGRVSRSGSQATGQVIVKKRKSGKAVAIRFRAYGQRHYVHLGYDHEGWDERRAAAELQNVLADVRRGIWGPPSPDPVPEPTAPQTFHEFASEWYEANKASWRPSTRADYLWQLTHHLLPFFAHHRLTEITVQEVDRYRQTKVAEGRLSAESINKSLTRLGQILDTADEYELITRNPMRVNPRKRKLRASRCQPVWLDRVEQIESLLDAAGQLDREARWDGRHIPRRAMLSVLVFGGLRLGEMLSLRWRDIDLATGRLRVAGTPDTTGSRETKTAAGQRFVELLPPLREALATQKADHVTAGPDDLVFATRRGTAFLRENFRNRVFGPVVGRANDRRDKAGLAPLPEKLSPHKLRHTAISLWFAAGWELPRVMKQAGHRDSATTLRVYAHVMETDPEERLRLGRLVGVPPVAPLSLHPEAARSARTM